MKPLGRKFCKLPKSKHKVKHLGKNIAGWWEDICTPNKTKDKTQAKKAIKNEIIDED